MSVLGRGAVVSGYDPRPGRDAAAYLAEVLQKASDEVEMTYPKPPNSWRRETGVLVVGVATGKSKPRISRSRDNWVFDITVRDGKVTSIREYIDTQAPARASQRDAGVALAICGDRVG
jgi:ketosteroid isomerase-like protein